MYAHVHLNNACLVLSLCDSCLTAADLRYMELEAAIAEVMTNKPFNLVHDERQIRKMMQLKESLDQRMGCVIGG